VRSPDRLTITDEEAAALDALRAYLPCQREELPRRLCTPLLAELERRGFLVEQTSISETMRQVMQRGVLRVPLVRVIEMDVRGMNALRVYHQRKSERRA